MIYQLKLMLIVASIMAALTAAAFTTKASADQYLTPAWIESQRLLMERLGKSTTWTVNTWTVTVPPKWLRKKLMKKKVAKKVTAKKVTTQTWSFPESYTWVVTIVKSPVKSQTKLEVITAMGYYSTGYVPATWVQIIPMQSDMTVDCFNLELAGKMLLDNEANYQKKIAYQLAELKENNETQAVPEKSYKVYHETQMTNINSNYKTEKDKIMEIYTNRYNLCIKN